MHGNKRQTTVKNFLIDKSTVNGMKFLALQHMGSAKEINLATMQYINSTYFCPYDCHALANWIPTSVTNVAYSIYCHLVKALLGDIRTAVEKYNWKW
jgi:hypothetical protein